MEAHESSLRALALTADGCKLATASNKGTLIRVWDVASATCLQEFRRGVERASITCLAWSWDTHWLACTSDKGTTHLFSLSTNSSSDSVISQQHRAKESTSYTQMFLAGVRKSVEGDTKKSTYQVRGLPHPQACAFVAEAHNVLAVAGWDADGNGVVMIVNFDEPPESTIHIGHGTSLSSSDFEPRRIGYHVFCRSNLPRDESEEARRRRRLRGWTPEIPETPEGGRLYVGERLELLERGMEIIQFEETDEFVSVTTVQPKSSDAPQEHNLNVSGTEAGTDNEVNNMGVDVPSPTSIKTETLDDDLEDS